MKQGDYALDVVGTFIAIMCDLALVAGAFVAIYLVFV